MLFRQEALDAKKEADNALGRVVLIRPVSFSIIALAAVLLALLVVTFLFVAEYSRRARVVGFTQPDRGLLKVSTPVSGVVSERLVEEGQRVNAGDTLFVISTERYAKAVSSSGSKPGDAQTHTAQERAVEGQAPIGAQAAIVTALNMRRASVEAERAQMRLLASQQIGSLRARQKQIDLELAQLAQEIELQRSRLVLVNRKRERYEALREANFVSAAAVAERDEEAIDQQARLNSAERARLGLLRERAQLVDELAQLPMRAEREQSTMTRSLAAVEQELAQAEVGRQVAITAPAAGTVSAVLAESGQAVGAQQLATLLPADASLQAVLFAPSRAAGFIERGQQVNLRLAAFPYQKFGQQKGHVLQVSAAPLNPQELPPLLSGAIGTAEPMVRVTVALDQQMIMAYGRPQTLAPGMQLEADILQDRRSLIEWIFEPLIGLKGKL